MNDPRVYFAAERTLLAWMRTGLAIMGLGFVVARFGLFLRMLRHEEVVVHPHAGSTLIGVGLVLLATAAVATAAWQHGRFCQTLTADEWPQRYSVAFAKLFAWLLASLGLALAGYLLWP